MMNWMAGPDLPVADYIERLVERDLSERGYLVRPVKKRGKRQ